LRRRFREFLESVLQRLNKAPQAPNDSDRGPDTAAPWPAYLSAAELAKRLDLPKESTRKKLERLAKKMDCFQESESPRIGEARKLYRVADVLDKIRG
jgi:hypothetical protein